MTVDANRPGFSASFAPPSVPLGGTATLTYMVDNLMNASPATSLAFGNALPDGLTVASPPNATTDCDAFGVPAVSADAGSGVISLSNGSVAASSTCTVSVDVTASLAGSLTVVSGDLTSNAGNSGRATAALDVTVDDLNLGAFFSGDPVPPGGTLSLDFTITNFDRDFEATNIAFSDDLDAALSGLNAVGLPISDICGTGSQLSGTTSLAFTGGTLAPGERCEFSVMLQVPISASPGVFTNTTSDITADVDGSPTTGGPGIDSFEVEAVPVLTKVLLTDPVAAGQNSDIEFTIVNTSAVFPATDMGFSDNLTLFLPGHAVSNLPAIGFCGAGSTITYTSLGFDQFGLVVAGANLVASDSCTFSVTLETPIDASNGTYTNTTSVVAGTVNGEDVEGPVATAELVIVAAPSLAKSFSEKPVAPGDTVTLEFTLTQDENANGDATGIAFTDDLDATLSGLVATGLPITDICGSGSELSGTTSLAFTGGTLAPDSACAFSVTLQVPASALTGNYPNTTSDVTATVLGEAVTGLPGTDTLEVATVGITKEFVDGPVFSGQTTTLEFTITNVDDTVGVTALSFTDDLDSVLAGMVAVGLPAADVCGAGSTLSGTSTITLTGGNLGPDSSCTIPVAVQIPNNAQGGEYTNTTSQLGADIDGDLVSLSPAVDTLVVLDALSFSKSFAQSSAAPGETVALEFTITNAHPDVGASNLSFTDNLGFALTGLVATGLPANDVCGSGSLLAGTDVVILTSGNLDPDSTCMFSVDVEVPADVGIGSVASNVTSELTGAVGGIANNAPPATDDLSVFFTTLTKSFEGEVEPGGITTLTFTLESLDTTNTLNDIAFTDDLEAVLPGLVALDLPEVEVCGESSVLEGTSLVTFRDGSLEPGASCTFSVDVQAPEDAIPGEYENVTSLVGSNGELLGEAATATLEVIPGPDMPDGGMDGGTDGGMDGGSDGGIILEGGGGCGCRTTTTDDFAFWFLMIGVVLWLRRRRSARYPVL